MHSCDIEHQLKQTGLRMTKDRHAILELFEQERTWTAAQIHSELPYADLSTIYRNLQTLIEKGLITDVHAHDGESHFERWREGHHDHEVCDACRVLACVPCPIKQLQPHSLELIGQCTACR